MHLASGPNRTSNRTHAIDGALGVTLKKLGFELGGLTPSILERQSANPSRFPAGP